MTGCDEGDEVGEEVHLHRGVAEHHPAVPGEFGLLLQYDEVEAVHGRGECGES